MRKITPSDTKLWILCWMAVFIIWHGLNTPVKAQPAPPSQTPVPKTEVSQPSTAPTTQPASPVSPAPAPSAPAPLGGAPARGGVVFNFDNADIYEVIRVMGEILRINYIVDPRVKGVVNIHTSGQIPAEETFPIFQSILRLNGATAVKRDGLYEIVPMSDAKKLPISPTTLQEPGKPISMEKYIIQIISVKYIPVAEVSKMIKPFLSDGADIVEHPPNNILIIGDLASNVKKSVDIISLFDLDIFTDLRVRIYPILNADVTEVAKEMERIFSSFEVSTKSGRGVGITFTPVNRINSLLVVSSIPNIFDKVEGWLKELDRTPTEGTKYSVFVYYVQNNKAKDLAEVLKQVFGPAKEKKAEFKEKVTTPEYPRGVKPIPTPSTTPATPTPPSQTPTPSKEEGGAIPEGEINIVVDETNNALVIRAFARDYKNIVETIKKLDLYPRQVLIEVLLAEITLDDSNKFGIEWARFLDLHGKYSHQFSLGVDPITTDPIPGPGAGVFRYSIVYEAGKFLAAIKLAATDNRLRVISSPHILASNNKEAKIQIGKAQPILTNTYTTTSTSTIGVVEGSIEYKDVGIIITVTPRISDGGLVTMEISLEDSSVDDYFLGRTIEGQAAENQGTLKVPLFKKKTAKTTLSVTEGQTIILGGLLEKTKNVKKSGIPLLSKIPILGGLFGAQEYGVGQNELVLMMTPHIITDHVQSKTVTDEFRERVEGLKKELDKEIKKKEKK